MRTVIAKSRPNGHYVALVVYGDTVECTEDLAYVVLTPDSPEDGCEFDGDLEAARKYYNEQVAEWAATPNWEMQAQYDEMHGTDNGYDPVIERHRREY